MLDNHDDGKIPEIGEGDTFFFKGEKHLITEYNYVVNLEEKLDALTMVTENEHEIYVLTEKGDAIESTP